MPSTGLPVPAPPGGTHQAFGEQLRKLVPAVASLPFEHRLEKGDPAIEILRVASEKRQF
jgi:hypothetical protein